MLKINIYLNAGRAQFARRCALVNASDNKRRCYLWMSFSACRTRTLYTPRRIGGYGRAGTFVRVGRQGAGWRRHVFHHRRVDGTRLPAAGDGGGGIIVGARRRRRGGRTHVRVSLTSAGRRGVRERSEWVTRTIGRRARLRRGSRPPPPVTYFLSSFAATADRRERNRADGNGGGSVRAPGKRGAAHNPECIPLVYGDDYIGYNFRGCDNMTELTVRLFLNKFSFDD